MRHLSALLVAALVACGGSTKSPPPLPPRTAEVPPTATADPDDAPLPLWGKLKRGTLPNGLTYYVLPHGKPEKRAMLWLAVNAGAVQEDDDQRGLAHFIEHMAFNGTKRFPEQKLVHWLEKIGMRFGADVNAYTSWDQTLYQLEVPTDHPELVLTGLDVLRDWAGDVTFDKEEVRKERGVVMEEWRLGQGAAARLFDKHAQVLFKGSRYANRLPIGLPEIIQKAPVENLVRYYRDWYRPELMAVIAVGDFDPDKIEQEIRARFGDLANPARPRPRPQGGVPPAEGTRVSIATDKEAQETSVEIANLVPHRPELSKRDYRRLLVEGLYTSILNQRLASIARRPEAPFLGAGSGIESVVRDFDWFLRSASAKNGKVEDTLRALLTEVVRVDRHGITATELERARLERRRFYERLAETEATSDSRQFTDEITRNFFENELIIGTEREKELALAILPTLTLEELNQVAASFGGPEGRVIMISGPEGEPLPNKERVLAIVAEVDKASLTPWEDKVSGQALMPTAPKAGTITKEVKRDAIGVTEWTLSNGARVIVKPTDFEADSVLIAGTSPGGEATVPDKDYPDARWAVELVEVGGIGELDVESVEKLLAGKRVSVSASIGESTESIQGGGSPKDLETLLQLIHLRMTAPRKDDQAIAVWRASATEQVTNALRSPEYRIRRESQALLYRNHPRRRVVEPGDFAKIDVDKAFAFYRDRFGDATDFTFVIVGAVDLAKLRPLVETYLASLPAKGRREKEKDLGIRKVGGVVRKEWKLASEPRASVHLDFHGPEKWSRDGERDLAILGDVLSIRLRETLREDLGGVYGVSAGGGLARSGSPERSFTVSFACEPQRVPELIKAVMDGTRALMTEGVDAATLAGIAESFRRERETELRTNGFWVGWLSRAYRFGDDPALVLDTSGIIARMTPAHVKAAARRYLDARQLFEAVVLPAPR